MVITSISFQNFCSFKDKMSMNFLVSEKAPQTSHFVELFDENTRFSKVSSIFGANGSGKTNIILLFKFLRLFISKSFSNNPMGRRVCSLLPLQNNSLLV